jgi:hypothetical protein
MLEGTASRAEPFAAGVLAAGGQGIAVEETVAAQRQPVQRPVVEAALEHVGVLAFAGQQVHALVPEHHAHRGAGFAVGLLVGQVIIGRKALVAARRADAPGDVHVAVDHVFPDGFHGLHVAVVAGDGRYVGGAV